MTFPFYKQEEATDCGIACLRMVAKYYGKEYATHDFRKKITFQTTDMSLTELSKSGEKLGFRTLIVKVTLQKLIEYVPLPCILYWNQNHFVVLYKVNSQLQDCSFIVANPALTLLKYDETDFKRGWCINKEEGIALLLEENK